MTPTPTYTALTQERDRLRAALDWIGNNLLRCICYNEPDRQGNWYSVTFYARSDAKPTTIETVYGKTFEETVATAMKGAALAAKEAT